MLEGQFWIFWGANVGIAFSSYYSGLFGLYDLETSKYWIPQIVDTKWSQLLGKIFNFSYFWPEIRIFKEL